MGIGASVLYQPKSSFSTALTVLLAGTLGLVCFLHSAAADRTDSKPVVLVINAAETEAARERESRFVTDLGLNIEGFAIRRSALDTTTRFNELSLNRQIEMLKPVMLRHSAVAAMWLTESDGNTLLLQVVVLDTGRALVRLFEEDLAGGSEENLALTAGELLGTAYMFEPEASKKTKEIEKLVDSTRIRAQVSPPARKAGGWKLLLSGRGAVGVVGGKGSNGFTGGSVGAERGFDDRWFIGVGGGAAAGPLGSKIGEFSISGYEITAELSGYLGVPVRRIRIGPFLQLRAGSAGAMVSASDKKREDYIFPCFFGVLGVDLRVIFTPRIALRIAAGVEASAIKSEIRRISDEGIIQKGSVLRVWGGLGLVLF